MSDELKDGEARGRTQMFFPGYRFPMPVDIHLQDRKLDMQIHLPEGIAAAYLQMLHHEILEVNFALRGANPAVVMLGYLPDKINLDKAAEIAEKIQRLQMVMKELKNAFYHRELDGGPKAAMEHPLYIQAQIKIDELQEELTLLT